MLPCVTHGLFIQHFGAAAVCDRSTCVAAHIISAEPNFFLAREFSQHEQHVSFILTSSILAHLEAFGLRTGLRRRNSVFARLERSFYRSEPRQESLTNATNAPRREMSATNDVSQSEDSANSLLDRSSAAASTKKRGAPSDTSEDDGAPASDAAPNASCSSSDAKRRRVEDPAPTSVPALEKIRRKLGTVPADLARPDEAVRLFSQRRGDSTCCYRTLMTLIFALCTLDEYRRALRACGLVRASGVVASVREIQGAIEDGWFWGFGFKGASIRRAQPRRRRRVARPARAARPRVARPATRMRLRRGPRVAREPVRDPGRPPGRARREYATDGLQRAGMSWGARRRYKAAPWRRRRRVRPAG